MIIIFCYLNIKINFNFKEIGLTPKELEEIMKGNSIHNVPLKKREEWLKMKQEREKFYNCKKAIKNWPIDIKGVR